MKKINIITLAIAAAAAFSLSSCNKEIEEVVIPTISVTEASLGFDAAGGTGTIEFTYDGEESVSAKAEKSWMSITGTTASSVSFSIAENEGAFSRTGIITLSAAGTTRQIGITQRGASYEINIDGETSRDIDGKTMAMDPAGKVALEIGYNAAIAANAPVVETEAGWIHSRLDDGKVIITADPCLLEARTADVKITMGWKSIGFKLSQEAAALFEGEDLDLTGDVKTGSIAYTDDIDILGGDWTIETPAWIQATKGEEGIELEFVPNTTGAERSGKVEVKYGEDVIFSITVKQEPVSAFVFVSFENLDREPSEVEIPGTEYYATLPENWTVETPDWVTATKGEDAVKLSITENTSGAAREGNINIIVDGNTVYTTKVAQTIYSYKFFLGTWEVSGGATTNHLTQLTFSANEDGETYTVTDWRVNSSTYKSLAGVATYEVKDGVPRIKITAQNLGKYSSTKWAWCGIYRISNETQKGSYTWAATASVDLVYNMDESGQKLELTDNGSMEGYTATGLYIFASTAESPNSDSITGYISRSYGGAVILSR